MHFTTPTVLLAALVHLSLAQSDDPCGCPSDYNYLQMNDACWCCPGTINALNNGDGNGLDFDTLNTTTITGYCCVHGSDSSSSINGRAAIPGVKKRQQAITIDGQVCSTTIQLTASDYSSLVLAASTLTGAAPESTDSGSSDASTTSATESSATATSDNSSAESASMTGSAAVASATGNGASGMWMGAGASALMLGGVGAVLANMMLW